MTNPLNAPRTDSHGVYQLKCVQCDSPFRTDNERARYCSEACKKRSANKRYYSRNKTRILVRVKRKRKKQK